MNQARQGRGYRRRKVANVAMLALAGLGTLVAIGFLLAVLGYILVQGGSALNLAFFTETPRPVGEPGGGMAQAIVGTLVLVALACLLGLPVGIGAGVYLAEYDRQSRLATAIRFTTDVLTGIPSITIGLFAYSLLVLPMRSFSALAGGVALAIIMLPTVARATEEMLRLVPASLREAGLALGIPRWKTALWIVVPTALSGILTGALLAVARVAGETAPLLFTAFGNRFWNWDLRQPIAALPLQLFQYAISPYEEWHRQAWAGALVLVGLVLLLSAAARALGTRSGPGR
ncbi:MAG: phosphate ABC transporter permease PstA [Chloroflexi bacterium]|nr:phosphate ABC transporter permease PstA [Chloroflexota bacterium]